jgi:hypothetical protein
MGKMEKIFANIFKRECYLSRHSWMMGSSLVQSRHLRHKAIQVSQCISVWMRQPKFRFLVRDIYTAMFHTSLLAILELASPFTLVQGNSAGNNKKTNTKQQKQKNENLHS